MNTKNIPLFIMWHISFFIIFADRNVKAFIERTSEHSNIGKNYGKETEF